MPHKLASCEIKPSNSASWFGLGFWNEWKGLLMELAILTGIGGTTYHCWAKMDPGGAQAPWVQIIIFLVIRHFIF